MKQNRDLTKTLVAALMLIGSSAGFGLTTRDAGRINNPDGTITIKNPEVAWGARWLNLDSYNDTDTCAALGFKQYLKDSGIWDNSKTVPTYMIDKLNMDASHYLTSEITCYNERNFLYRYSNLTNNPDGTVTIKNPMVAWGSQWLNLSSNDNHEDSVCKALGFNRYLKDSGIWENSKTVPTYVVNEANVSDTFYLTSEITCFEGRLANNVFKVGTEHVGSQTGGLMGSQSITDAVAVQNISQNLIEISKVIYEDRSKLFQGLAEDVKSEKIVTKDFSSNILLFFATDAYIKKLTSKVVEEQVQPLYKAEMERLEKQGWNSIQLVPLNLQTLNMAVAILQRSLHTISDALDERSKKDVQLLIINLSEKVAVKETLLSKANALASYCQDLTPKLQKTLQINQQTEPEISMNLAICGWILSKN